ncbi:MAG: TonB-dependent receptor [Muribaculum sp.]|nr:TonB-dependent receptor [Muribaculaceae bacterium]MCM1081688.1 TonB-dependent receptor [Muribaculum sp.]
MKKSLLACGVVAMSLNAAATADVQDDTTVVLKQIEVVANRATVKTPVAFTNVTKEELVRYNDGRDLTYLLQATPSVITTSDAGAGMGYTSMRVRGTDGSRINVTANGVPINNSESHNVYWVNMPDLASSLRDVQIQRGAGTSVNGAGAFGASVNMITDAPSLEQYAEISGSYGMYNTNRETIRIGSGMLGDHWSFDGRLSHMGSDGYIDRASSKLWSYFTQAAYQNRGTLVRLIIFGGKEETYMAWDYASKEDMKRYGRRYNPCGQYTDSDGKTAYYRDQKDYFTQHHFQLHLSQVISDKWRMSAALHYTDDYGYYNQYKTKRTLQEYGLDNFVTADGATVTKSDLIRLKFNDNGFGGGVASFNYNHAGWNVILGGGANYFHGRHFGRIAWVRNYVGPINPLQEYYLNIGKKFDSNIYARANYDINSHFSAFADLQYRHIHYTIDGQSDNFDWNTESPMALDINRHWNFFNPKAGINYINGRHKAFASWSVANKEPVRDNFTDGDPNHRPQSERLFDYELGYSFNTSLLSIGVNLYYMDYKDQLVVTGQLSDTGNPLSVNTPDSYRAGIELQGSLKPCSWFRWDINATLSRNRIKNFVEYIYEDEWTNPIAIDRGDTPIAFSPDFILNNAFNFTVARFDAQLASHYVGKQYMNNAGTKETTLDSYFVTDLHLGYTFKQLRSCKSLHLGFSVYNLLNEKYFNNGYCGAGYTMVDGKAEIYRYAGYAAQAPIHVMANISVRF